MTITAEERWGAYDALVTIIPGETLQNLANSALIMSPSPIDFTAAGADKKKYLDFTLSLAQVDLTAQVNPAVLFWIICCIDGTNYEYPGAGGSLVPARRPDGIIPVPNTNAAHPLFYRMALSTPDKAHVLVQNRTGAAFTNDTNNVMKYYLYGSEIISL